MTNKAEDLGVLFRDIAHTPAEQHHVQNAIEYEVLRILILILALADTMGLSRQLKGKAFIGILSVIWQVVTSESVNLYSMCKGLQLSRLVNHTPPLGLAYEREGLVHETSSCPFAFTVSRLGISWQSKAFLEVLQTTEV